MYHEIYEIFKKMEKINSDRFILTIGQSFITATSYMYCALVYIAKPLTLFGKQQNFITSSGFLRWTVSSSFAVLTLVYPCQYVADKVPIMIKLMIRANISSFKEIVIDCRLFLQGKEVVSAALVLRIKTDKPKLKNEVKFFLIDFFNH